MPVTPTGFVEREIRRRVGGLKDHVRSRDYELLQVVGTDPRTARPLIEMHRRHIKLLKIAVCFTVLLSFTAAIGFVTRPFPWNFELPIVTALFVGLSFHSLVARNPGAGWHGLFGSGFLGLGVAVGSPALLICRERLVLGCEAPNGMYAALELDYGIVEKAAVVGGVLKVGFAAEGAGIALPNPLAEEPVHDDGVHTELAQAVRIINSRAAAHRASAAEAIGANPA